MLKKAWHRPRWLDQNFRNVALSKARGAWNFGKNEVSAIRRQLSLDIPHPVYEDRNRSLGGRSFYFFDFDDNVAFLTTPIYIFHNETKKELALTSGEYAQVHHEVGRSGPYRDYFMNYDDAIGSFRNFRDRDHSLLDRLKSKRQIFVEDLAHALGRSEFEWKGPAWDTFFHAVYNKRPLSVITARGHHPETIKKGIELLIEHGHLHTKPNYHTIYPVSHPDVRRSLGDVDLKMDVATLKKLAIRKSVEKALREYGAEYPHRFGMSDDDPKNIQLIVEEMASLKKEFPHLGFFVIETKGGVLVKAEVYADHLRTLDQQRLEMSQLSLL